MKDGNGPKHEPLFPQLGQHRMRVRKQRPGTRIFKDLKDLLKEVVEALEHPDAIKHIVHNVEPPEPLALLQLDRIRCGKNRGRRIAKSTLKGLCDQCLRVGSLPKPMLNCMFQVDVRHGAINMKQRLGCIEKDDVNGGLHRLYEPCWTGIVGSSKTRSQLVHRSCGFLTKNTPTA